MRLEKAINPLLDDNDQVAFSFILETIAGQMKNVENVGILNGGNTPFNHVYEQMFDDI